MRIHGVLLCTWLAACGGTCDGCGTGEAPEKAGLTGPDGGPPAGSTIVKTPLKRNLGRYYKPREDGPEFSELKKARKELQLLPISTEAPSEFDALASALPDALGEFDAAGAASQGPTRALGSQSVRVARRIYKDGSQTAIVKITDARQAPGLLLPVADRLDMQGLPATGNEQGLLVNGKPALESYYKEHRNSRLTVVDGIRLIEIRVTGTDDPHAARKVFTALSN